MCVYGVCVCVCVCVHVGGEGATWMRLALAKIMTLQTLCPSPPIDGHCMDNHKHKAHQCVCMC